MDRNKGENKARAQTVEPDRYLKTLSSEFRATVMNVLYLSFAIGLLIAPVVFVGLGASLVYMGVKGDITLTLFGQDAKNVGGAALCLAAVIAVVLVRRLISSIERLRKGIDEDLD